MTECVLSRHHLQRDRSSLAGLARALGRGREVLYHGTRNAQEILKTGKLFFAWCGDPVVCFTRCPEEAAYWASLEGDYDKRPAVLIFDRRSLSSHYSIEPYCDNPNGEDLSRRDEMEERVWCTDIDISPHLIGYVSGEGVDRTPEERRRAYEYFARLKSHPGRSVRTLPLAQCFAWARQSRSRAIAALEEADLDTEVLLVRCEEALSNLGST
jgi:hypothetical protein